ncbi:hypothetical protein GCM10009676_44400 [Prauserella halophila]|uniref:Secreted protein n=1 Tax=Prauserella halophila TaxID=185641 RepID=A0ABP4H7A9_9PSEU
MLIAVAPTIAVTNSTAALPGPGSGTGGTWLQRPRGSSPVTRVSAFEVPDSGAGSGCVTVASSVAEVEVARSYR